MANNNPNRQATLYESWKGNNEAGPSGISSRFRGRGGYNSPNIRGRGGRGQRRGRARGARGSSSRGQNINVIELDDDDRICNQALGDYEERELQEGFNAFEDVDSYCNQLGFEKTEGQMWIYPTNRPVRDYQFNISKTCLFNNTLVCLPTGLGKTFVAAVVMYNFHRWYPNGLIVFMAPTRPLVAQQIEACHNIVGIDPSKTFELTGQTSVKKRESIWKEKQVFFLTPQVLLSDINRRFCDSTKIRCVVIDEAHKAMGKYAAAQVVSLILKENKNFRVLALSATPGSDQLSVQQVLKNLLISKIELRSETSNDILPYTHQKQGEKIIVQLDPYVKAIYDQMLEIFQTYTGRLMKKNVLFGRDGTFAQFQLLKSREEYRRNSQNIPSVQRGFIESDYATSISLAHCVELLHYYGLRTFYLFTKGVLNGEKGIPTVSNELRKNTCIVDILEGIQKKLNIYSENSSFSLNKTGLFTTLFKTIDTSVCENLNETQEDYLQSHPKLRVLKDIVEKHFNTFAKNNQSTRIMIFSKFRDSVNEIGNLLRTMAPLVVPMVFVGQTTTGSTGGRGLKQKEQIEVVQRFRDGGFNVLVSTSVGEEGLDIGEVDLIICFDSNNSPTRLVQRMGRTGRQREGKIIFLLTAGKEERMYTNSMSLQSNISKSILDPSTFEPFLYKYSPKMLPKDYNPEVYKMSVILTSEQKIHNLEEAEGDSDFEPTTKGKRKGTSKKAGPRKKAKPEIPNPILPPKENTIEKCLVNMEKRTLAKVKETPKTIPKNPPIEIILDESIQEEKDEDYNTMLDVYGVQKISKTSESQPCFFVPKPKKIYWDLIKQKKLINLNDDEIYNLREKINTIICIGRMNTTCDCGNAIDFDEEFEADEDFNFIPQSEIFEKFSPIKSPQPEDKIEVPAKSSIPEIPTKRSIPEIPAKKPIPEIPEKRSTPEIPTKSSIPEIIPPNEIVDDFEFDDDSLSWMRNLSEMEEKSKSKTKTPLKNLDKCVDEVGFVIDENDPIFHDWSQLEVDDRIKSPVRLSPIRLSFPSNKPRQDDLDFMTCNDKMGSLGSSTTSNEDFGDPIPISGKGHLSETPKAPHSEGFNTSRKKFSFKKKESFGPVCSTPIHNKEIEILNNLEISPKSNTSFGDSKDLFSPSPPTDKGKGKRGVFEEIRIKKATSYEKLSANAINTNSNTTSSTNTAANTPENEKSVHKFRFKNRMKVDSNSPVKPLSRLSSKSSVKDLSNLFEIEKASVLAAKNKEIESKELKILETENKLKGRRKELERKKRELEERKKELEKMEQELDVAEDELLLDEQILMIEKEELQSEKNNFNSSRVSSEVIFSPDLSPIKKKRRRPKNPFVEDEAEVSGDEISPDEEEEGLTDFDESFVSNNKTELETVTESQHCRYLKSLHPDNNAVRIPNKLHLIQEAAMKKVEVLDSVSDINDSEEYEQDSFCTDEVEFTENGVFTQAMMEAKASLQQVKELGIPSSRNLRRKK